MGTKLKTPSQLFPWMVLVLIYTKDTSHKVWIFLQNLSSNTIFMINGHYDKRVSMN